MAVPIRGRPTPHHQGARAAARSTWLPGRLSRNPGQVPPGPRGGVRAGAPHAGAFSCSPCASRGRPVRRESHFSHCAGRDSASRPRLPTGDREHGGGLGRRGQTLVKRKHPPSVTATRPLNGAPQTTRVTHCFLRPEHPGEHFETGARAAQETERERERRPSEESRPRKRDRGTETEQRTEGPSAPLVSARESGDGGLPTRRALPTERGIAVRRAEGESFGRSEQLTRKGQGETQTVFLGTSY